jgi:Glycosyltransferase family 87
VNSALKWSPALRRVFTPDLAPNRLLRGLLALGVIGVAIRTSWLIGQDGALSVDLEIPLRAAERFVAGQAPYLASAFQVTAGPTLPYLYPPFVLPLLVPLLGIPRLVLWTVWFGVCLVAAILTLRRLGFPVPAWPLVIIWPPLWEAVWHGNAAILMFAALVCLFYGSRPLGPYQPADRIVAMRRRFTVRDGLMAAAIAALKPSELHAWLYVLRRRPGAAIVAGLGLAVVLVGTLAFTGLGLWADWVAQLARAADPHWVAFGASTARFLPQPLALAITAACLLGAPFVPERSAGSWLGLLMVVGAASLRGYDLIFLLPALLTIRREIALLAGLLAATYAIAAVWAAIVLVGGAMVLGVKVPGLLEPARAASMTAREVSSV